jgi:uncharacterized protein YcbK (DUF882 family)
MSGWEYFTKEEMACPHCGESKMDEDFMRRLNRLRQQFGKPIIVTSGYRCPEYNDQISSTGRDGPHTTGRAVDIHVYGEDAHRVLFFALTGGFSGIGIKQHGDYDGRFIHLDTIETGTRPWVWTYRDE